MEFYSLIVDTLNYNNSNYLEMRKNNFYLKGKLPLIDIATAKRSRRIDVTTKRQRYSSGQIAKMYCPKSINTTCLIWLIPKLGHNKYISI